MKKNISLYRSYQIINLAIIREVLSLRVNDKVFCNDLRNS